MQNDQRAHPLSEQVAERGEEGAGTATVSRSTLHAPPLTRKLKSLLLFRLLLGLLFLILTILVQSRHQWDFLAARLQPLYFFSIAIFLFTIVAAITLNRVQNLKRFAYLQLFFDVATVTTLIFLSGGVESIFSCLYMPVIISAALLLNRPGSLWTASMCSIAYGILLDLQYFKWIVPLEVVSGTSYVHDSGFYFHSLLMNIAAFYLVAYLSGYLAGELQKSSAVVKEQRKDLRELEALHRNTVRSINSGLLTIDRSGTILFSNPASLEILDLKHDQIEGRSIQELLPSFTPPIQPPVGSCHNEKSSLTMNRMELFHRRPDGKELCLGYTTSVLHSDNGQASGWVFIFQDLTRLKAMEENMRRMERLAYVGNIAAEIAHEIKNPLASISGAVELVQDDLKDDPTQTRLFNIMLREIQRIDELVNNFLLLTRGARNRAEKSAVAVVDTIQDILALLRARRKISFSHEVTTSFEIRPHVLIDPNHFHQIIWNLVVNALAAMPAGGELFIRVVGVRRGSDADHFRIDVRDTGAGIAEEILEKMPEPFFTTKENGTGLGLSVVYQLVENSGGSIEVSRPNGAGTTFSLFFPHHLPFPLAK
ncbi:MAG: ATP-binding protein [Desulforhabdus sp.]|jgi:two-component system sensor histidine kinase PilS (NtrC family)|nr:ATP-binding protein [Desulforhabdus sp.]